MTDISCYGLTNGSIQINVDSGGLQDILILMIMDNHFKVLIHFII